MSYQTVFKRYELKYIVTGVSQMAQSFSDSEQGVIAVTVGD